MRALGLWIALGLLLAALGAAWLWRARGAGKAEPAVPTPAAVPAEAGPAAAPTDEPTPVPTPAAVRAPAAEFVDESACAACHRVEAERWHGSDHDLAMQEATEETVRADFADARFRDGSTDTLFTRDGQGFAVETEGPDGARARFRVPYLFGVDPLQQVLLELPRGRLQALSVAWDPRARRWFSLYPDEHIDAADPLHWTRPPQNWNFACAECHATDLRRNYEAETDSYRTSWKRLDVGCQACHGPGARHIDWALEREDAPEGPGRGFEPGLGAPDATGSRIEVEACARCHARRAPLGDGFDHRNRLLDDYLPALLTEGLYHADGQLLDEVYEYGSFLQSKMHAHGVRCSDCHDPHSLALTRPDNLTCTSCHSPTPTARPHVDLTTLQKKNYDSPEHHHHAPGTSGARCVDCHMPQHTYMVVDPRRDHGFRVPRPDLAAATGAPDACTACHGERDATWAAERIEEWYGRKERPAHWGVALAAGRTGRAGAAEALLALAGSAEPPIVRATALSELLRYPSVKALSAFEAGTHDPDGLVRLAALAGFELLAPAERVAALAPLLTDPLRALRAESARMLVGAGADTLGAHEPAWRAALAEYEAIQGGLLERAEARLNRAQLYSERGELAAAERELRVGVRLDPAFIPAWVNLAELARGTRGEPECEGLLREALRKNPDDPVLLHALGLALVRVERSVEGLAALGRAAELQPDDPRFAYVHAVALHDLGQPDAARTALTALVARHPGYRDAHFALASYLEESGDAEGARRCLAALAAINPDDPLLAPVAAGGAGR